jgi:hypothetical protein
VQLINERILVPEIVRGLHLYIPMIPFVSNSFRSRVYASALW